MFYLINAYPIEFHYGHEDVVIMVDDYDTVNAIEVLFEGFVSPDVNELRETNFHFTSDISWAMVEAIAKCIQDSHSPEEGDIIYAMFISHKTENVNLRSYTINTLHEMLDEYSNIMDIPIKRE